MGIYTCESCDQELCGETFGCKACAYAQGDGNVYCDGCASNAPCGKCGDSCCVRCSEALPCCGIVVCGSGNVDVLKTAAEMRASYGVTRDACIWKHDESASKLACGHQGCNFHPEGCFTCASDKAKQAEAAAVETDKALVAKLLAGGNQLITGGNILAPAAGDVKSKSLAAALQEWLTETADAGSASKRQRGE
ncbi:hypothetical protein T484DRAFT_1949491 [Baffinella frigidus]|nr:hypothetical protein T484DRAFT_1949491 [Cryptophyta sp. CCMP2293]